MDQDPCYIALTFQLDIGRPGNGKLIVLTSRVDTFDLSVGRFSIDLKILCL